MQIHDLCFSVNKLDKLETNQLTRAAKYEVSVSFPPSCLITSVTAANTARICSKRQYGTQY